MSADITESTQSDVSGGAKDVDVDQFGKEAGQLLDLSCRFECRFIFFWIKVSPGGGREGRSINMVASGDTTK